MRQKRSIAYNALLLLQYEFMFVTSDGKAVFASVAVSYVENKTDPAPTPAVVIVTFKGIFTKPLARLVVNGIT